MSPPHLIAIVNTNLFGGVKTLQSAAQLLWGMIICPCAYLGAYSQFICQLVKGPDLSDTLKKGKMLHCALAIGQFQRQCNAYDSPGLLTL